MSRKVQKIVLSVKLDRYIIKIAFSVSCEAKIAHKKSPSASTEGDGPYEDAAAYD